MAIKGRENYFSSIESSSDSENTINIAVTGDNTKKVILFHYATLRSFLTPLQEITPKSSHFQWTALDSSPDRDRVLLFRLPVPLRLSGGGSRPALLSQSRRRLPGTTAAPRRGRGSQARRRLHTRPCCLGVTTTPACPAAEE
jgi:hypothetical protein